jgi:hypothetical protein
MHNVLKNVCAKCGGENTRKPWADDSEKNSKCAEKPFLQT